MNFREYQSAAMRSYKDGSIEPLKGQATQALLGAIGMAGEVGECTEPVKKWFFHRKGTFETVRAKLREEIGDVLWYAALLAKAFDLDLQEIADNNIAKLMARYPDPPPLERAMADALDPTFQHHDKAVFAPDAFSGGQHHEKK